MNEPNENVRYLNGGAADAGQSIVRVDTDEASRKLVEARRARQSRQSTFGVAKPERAPADQTTWLGGRKYSPAVRKHNEKLDDIEFAEIEAEYAMREGMRLEYVGVDEGSRTVTAEVDVFRSLPANSLESVITQELVLDSVDRIRRMATQASEQYLRRALR